MSSLESGDVTTMARASVRGVALVAAAFAVQATSGCLSNEYRIQKDELQRLAELPPQTRGHVVRVSQQLGSRREDALDEPPGYVANDDVDLQVNLDGSFSADGGPSRASSSASGAWRGSAGRGTPPSANGGTVWKGTPPPSSPHGGFHGTPSGGGSGGGGSFNFSGGGGSGNGGDALAVLAVVVVVSAAVATVALAASEGMRFEGHVDVAPEQPVHLVYEGDGAREIPLGALTTQDLVGAKHALVMDDEGFGLRRLDHAPLERQGGVFRFELGAGRFNFGDLRATGFSSNIGAGYFPTSHFGLALDLGLGSGSVDSACCVGPAWTSSSIGRYSVGLEAQAFPLNLGPLHVGAFGGGGFALVGPAGARESGPQASGGALLELDLTSHMALTLRGGASAARLPGGWSSGGALTGGLAIY